MRDATAEIAALAKQGIHLDAATKADYRAELDRINAEPPAVAQDVKAAPEPPPKRTRKQKR